MQTRNQKNC